MATAPVIHVAGDLHLYLGPTAAEVTAPILAALATTKGVIMTELDDLKAADADLAAEVATLTDAVNRIDTDFTNLEAAVAAGDPAAIAAEAANVRAAVDALKGLHASIDATDPAPAVEPAPEA